MTNAELQQAITNTAEEIWELQQQIEHASDPREQKKLMRKLKELQYLQLWHLDQLEDKVK